jgi:membrane-associated HD superfamily phosphohydrolase
LTGIIQDNGTAIQFSHKAKGKEDPLSRDEEKDFGTGPSPDKEAGIIMLADAVEARRGPRGPPPIGSRTHVQRS